MPERSSNINSIVIFPYILVQIYCMKKTALYLLYVSDFVNILVPKKEHEYNCSKTSQKNTIRSKTKDISSVFEHL